jgi:two-component system sensor histidine kinase BaeS
MKEQSNIFSKLFIGVLSASLLVLAIMSVIFVFAIKTSIAHWNKDEALDMGNLLSPVIAKVYRLSGSLNAGKLESAILPYTTDSMYVYVFDENRKPVLFLNRGQRVTQKTVEKEVGSLSTFLSLNAPIPVKDGDDIIAYLSVNSRDFLAYKANRQFISTMRKSIAAGVVTAILLALFISIYISSKFSKQTQSLVEEIASLGDGKRNIVFSHSNTAEFDLIANSEEKLQDQLVKEESLRRQWMLDVSHDLRTPVTAVKVQLEAMHDDVLASTKARLENLLSELTHIERLVNNLHDLSRYESPEMKINPVMIDPAEFTDTLKEQFTILAEQKKLLYTCECDEVIPFAADEFLLQRCVANVIQNAVKYTGEGGEIKYRLFSTDTDSEIAATAPRTEKSDAVKIGMEKQIIIEVKNTGTLSEETLTHVFDRLYRGDKSRTDGGSGLGLSIAKAIMTLHHGTISIANKDGFVCLTMKFPYASTVQ